MLVQWIETCKLHAEIIVVVDGENLATYENLSKLSFVKVAGYPVNKGKGYAIKFGFKMATAPLIIYTDADIPFEGNSILKMFETLQQYQHQNIWVIGDRTLPGSVYFENISWLRKAGSDLFLLIIKHTLGERFADTQCGLKGFTKKGGEMVFAQSKINRFAFDFECLFIAGKLDLKVIEIPVILRNQSPSTVRLVRDGSALLKDVLKVIFINRYD